ncbi:hypothetical protein P4S73_12535 [Paraglaciecola sp. Hal342]
MLLACGGGGSDAISRDGSSDGDDTPDPITYSVSLSLVNADGQTDGQLSASNPLTLTARVTDNTGAIATDQLVTFTFNPEGLAEFGNDSGTATTGTTGDATISLLVGENSGSGEVIATLSDGQSASTTFTSQGDNARERASKFPRFIRWGGAITLKWHRQY